MIGIHKNVILLSLGLTLCSTYIRAASWSGLEEESDLFKQASDLLVEKTNSNEIIDNIKVAEEILANNQNGEFQQIFQEFVALKPLVEQIGETKLVCSDENMNSIKAIESTMHKFIYKGWPIQLYVKAKEDERLKRFVVALSEQVGSVCLEPLIEQFNSLEPKLDDKRVAVLKKFSNYKDDEFYKPEMLIERAREETPINLSKKGALDWADKFVRMNVALYGEHRMCIINPIERNYHAPIEFVQEKFDDLIVKTCNYFINERKDLVPILEETLKIARNINLDPNTAPGAYVKDGLADVASNYVVCKRLRGVDYNTLIENIAEHLPQAEREYSAYSYDDVRFLRLDLETGC